MRWEADIHAMVGKRYKIKLGKNGFDLVLSPKCYRWPLHAFQYVVEHQDVIRRSLAS